MLIIIKKSRSQEKAWAKMWNGLKTLNWLISIHEWDARRKLKQVNLRMIWGTIYRSYYRSFCFIYCVLEEPSEHLSE